MNPVQGYFLVLRNGNFLKLWVAQILSLMSLQSLLFLALILMEEVQKLSIQTAGVIVAFSLPAVIFGPLAGTVLDRVPKKITLIVSNALRVASQLALALLAYLGLNRLLEAAAFVVLVYLTIFITSAVGQFFAPAEGATIPLVVSREQLLAANSLFTLTIIATQVIALILYVPFAVKLLGLVGAFLSLALFYAGATLLLLWLPKDQSVHHAPADSKSALRQAWREIGEGWTFALARRPILIAILQFALVSMIVAVLGQQAPGYAARVLGLATEDAVFVFSPAGIGMMLASILIVRIGPRWSRFRLPILGIILMGVGLLGLGWLGLGGKNVALTTFEVAGATIHALWLIGLISPLAGIGLALVVIPAQTIIQEQSPDEIRGRVLTVQLTFANALSIPFLIVAGGLSDLFGIPQIVILLGVLLFPLAAFNWLYVRRLPPLPPAPYHTQPMPMPGETVAMVEEVNA